MRMTVPPDSAVPSHSSPDEDKLFVVLAASLRFQVGDEFSDVDAGQQIAVAKGDTHGFVNVTKTTATLGVLLSLALASPALASDQDRHPLDPLTSDEISVAVSVLN
jgi:quercetin dioxygenase-like cupin family protein